MIYLSKTLFACKFSQAFSLSRYLNPVRITPIETTQIPMLKLKSQKFLMKNWWSEHPFIIENNSMKVPVFSFHTAEFNGKQIELPQDIFNEPLRRDLMYRLYDFRINLNKFTTKTTRNRATTAGSSIKMRPQKGQGKARMGDKRAPHLRKGGKAHGAKPKVYSYTLNSKIKLNALKALLTSKLVEGKIKIVDSEQLAEPKTKELFKIITTHHKDDRTLFCIITSKNRDQNFEKAQRNIERVIWHDTYNLDVVSLFKADKILITVKGLEELIENLYKTHYVIYRQPHMPKIEDLQNKNKPTESVINVNPEEPYEFKFRILAEYLELYEKIKRQQPDIFAREQARIRKVSK